jgi:hypothetical protein
MTVMSREKRRAIWKNIYFRDLASLSFNKRLEIWPWLTYRGAELLVRSDLIGLEGGGAVKYYFSL